MVGERFRRDLVGAIAGPPMPATSKVRAWTSTRVPSVTLAMRHREHVDLVAGADAPRPALLATHEDGLGRGDVVQGAARPASPRRGPGSAGGVREVVKVVVCWRPSGSMSVAGCDGRAAPGRRATAIRIHSIVPPGVRRPHEIDVALGWSTRTASGLQGPARGRDGGRPPRRRDAPLLVPAGDDQRARPRSAPRAASGGSASPTPSTSRTGAGRGLGRGTAAAAEEELRRRSEARGHAAQTWRTYFACALFFLLAAGRRLLLAFPVRLADPLSGHALAGDRPRLRRSSGCCWCGAGTRCASSSACWS